VGLVAALHRCKTDWRILAPLLFVNVLGMGFGWYYYADVGQFDLGHLTCGDGATESCQPWWTWPLVADSPNAVALFFIAALAYKVTGWRNKWLDAFAFILNVYVGCWTTFLFLAYSDRMGTFDYGSVAEGNANPVLFIAHMGMPAQAFVLLKDMRKDNWGVAGVLIVLASLVAYMAVDYWATPADWISRGNGVLHPAPFLHPDDATLHVGAHAIMVIAALAWLAIVLWPRSRAVTRGRPATASTRQAPSVVRPQPGPPIIRR
jgi:uncharacterized membrane protein YpjA